MESKFVLIGVGSVCFGAGTINDLLLFKDDLAGSTVALVDIRPEILELMAKLAHRLNREAGEPFKIVASTDRREVLGGAEFVVTSPAVEREERWKTDWDIISAAGIKQTYGENGGPGALSHTLRNVPMLLDICRDVEALAPGAWLINFTNPESRICMALDRHSKVRFAGLCHGIAHGYRMVSEMLGIPVEELEIKAAGLNHFTWMYEIRRRSNAEDLYPAVRKLVDGGGYAKERMTQRMLQLTGMLPVLGDHHLAEYLAFGWEYQGLHGRDFAWYHRSKADNVEWLKGVADGTRPVSDRIKGHSGERVANMAVAMLKNLNTYEESVDIRNDGAIPNLPADAIVEVPGVVSSMGITPLRMAPLPEFIAALAVQQVRVQELSVEAAVTGDRDTALAALALDPVVDSLKTAEKVLGRLLEAHRDLVSPNFFR